MATKIYLIRHGESQQNVDDVLSGITNIPLSENGKQQCVVLSHYFDQMEINKIYSSPLQRAINSASIIFSNHRNEIKIDNSLLEINYGIYEGYNRLNYENSNDDVIKQWISAPADLTFPGGDNIQDHAIRVFEGLLILAMQNSNSTIACVSHRTTIRLIIAQIIGLSLNKFRSLPCSNCGISEITFDQNWKLLSLNVTPRYLQQYGGHYGNGYY